MTEEFDNWLFGELSVKERVAIEDKVNFLKEFGPTLGRPHADTLTGTRISNLKELRGHTANAELRALYAFDPQRRAVLLIGGNKTGKWNSWYRTAIPKAEELFYEHLKSEGGK